MTGGLVNAPNAVFESITGEYIAAINKNQRQTDMVIDFLKFWISKPGYDAWIAGYETSDRGWQPGGPVLISDVNIPPKFDAVFESIGLDKKEGNPMTTPDRLLTSVVGGGAGKQQEAFELFRRVLEDEITPRQFADMFQAMMTNGFGDIVKAIGLSTDLVDHPERSPTE
jgi:hypothetical protein